MKRPVKLLPWLLVIGCAGAAIFLGPSRPISAGSDPLAAWVELGPGSVTLARVLTRGPACPPISIDGQPRSMAVHAPPTVDFPVLVCEAALPPGIAAAAIENVQLPLPKASPGLIVVLGDTGCRVSVYEGKTDVQACNDPAQWPAARVAAGSAASRPDLVIHVGDYLYRESACPADFAGCSGSPYGDNLATWMTDFFQPEARLLSAAPFVFMRGNHETCDREWNGYFRFLDPGPLPAVCPDSREPFAIQAGDVQLLMLDSSKYADDFSLDPVAAAIYERQFDALRALAGPNAFMLTHAPIWAFGHGGETDGKEQLYRDDENLQAGSHNELPASVQAVISGHLHLFEALGFDHGRPAQLIVGNGGTELDPAITSPLTGLAIAGATVTDGRTFHGFGFLTLERAPGGWRSDLHDSNGDSVLLCMLLGRSLTCRNTAADPP